MDKLLHNTKYSAKYPRIDFIMDKIKKNNFFTFSKISVEWWQTFYGAIKNINLNEKNINYEIINKNSKKISENMVNFWNTTQDQSRNWGVSVETFESVINYITKKCPKNFIIGITDRTPGQQYFKNPCYPDIHRPRQKHLIKIINKTIHKNNILYDAMCWKYWGCTNKLDNIINYANKKNIKIVIVGPESLKDFNKICNIKNYSYLNIHSTHSVLYVKAYKKMIKSFDENINENKIYMMQGGSSAMWLCVNLHNQLKNSFIFDVGKGLNMYMRKCQEKL